MDHTSNDPARKEKKKEASLRGEEIRAFALPEKGGPSRGAPLPCFEGKMKTERGAGKSLATTEKRGKRSSISYDNKRKRGKNWGKKGKKEKRANFSIFR